MKKRHAIPCALSIAGSDSGGGAGIQADLNVFSALGVHGTTAITCLTAQNPKEVTGIYPATAKFVRMQMEAVFSELRPRAVKTGMLYSREIIAAVADFFSSPKGPPLIVDPVMVATSGAALLKRNAVSAMKDRLLPRATLTTPNVPEAELLVEMKIRDVEDLRKAARQIQRKFGCAVLAKGGHLPGIKEAVDIFFDGETELLLKAPYIRGVTTHGTGCTLSAAVAGYCALGHDLADAVQLGKDYLTSAIAGSRSIGRWQALNWFR